MTRWLLTVAAVAVSMAARGQPVPAAIVPPPGGGLTEEGQRLLRAHVAGGVDAELRWSDFAGLRPELERFYGGRGWTLAWLADGKPTDAAWRVAEALSSAARKGLDPLDYGAAQLEPRLALADRAPTGEPERARLDVALTVSTLRYASDVAMGRIRPVAGTELLGRVQLARGAAPAPDLAALVAAAAASVDPERILASAEPDWPAYRRTLAALDGWLRRLAAPRTAPLAVPAEPAAPERYPEASRLAGALTALGFAPAQADDGAPACSSPIGEALARYQARNGLDATGLVDAATVEALNAPPERRVAQLALSLERWRWFGRRPPASWIVVNVPEFALRAGNGEGALAMRVVVGQAYEWGTPLLASELSLVTFRPAWGVPLEIQQEELVPRVEKDRAFVASGGFEVVDEAERPAAPVTTGELLAGLRSGALRLVQRPGAGNALGLVKLSLARSSWLYLHGTPAPELFARSRRDFSHGCIRVEDPVALTSWVLRDEPGWSPAAVRAAMAGARTLDVTPRRPTTVLIGYFTAAAWDEGPAGFHEDVYGQDAALVAALREEAARRGGE